MAPKMIIMTSRRPPGTPWAPGGYQDAIEIGPRALLEASGVEKIRWFRPGGLQKSSWIICQRLEPPPVRFWPPFWELLGAPGESFWRLLAENPQTLDFEYLPRENLDFEGSGGHFWSVFVPK